jgi:hypothetical protein
VSDIKGVRAMTRGVLYQFWQSKTSLCFIWILLIKSITRFVEETPKPKFCFTAENQKLLATLKPKTKGQDFYLHITNTKRLRQSKK